MFRRDDDQASASIDIGRQASEPTESVLGEILQSRFGLTDADVAKILGYQQDRGVRFGEAAVALGYIRSEDVIWALSQQFHYPYSSKSDESSVSSEVISANAPFSEQAEFFRSVRSELLMGVFAQPGIRKSLAVTSPDSGDGKTYFAENIAVAFSQLGVKTLLVDADMRNPSIHHHFNINVAHGLSHILADRTSVNVLRPSKSLPNLYVLPVGIKPPNPTELIQRPALDLVMNELGKKFDYVIVDTPALHFGSDGLIVASKCGATVSIARKNHTRREDLSGLVARLARLPSAFAGVIINNY